MVTKDTLFWIFILGKFLCLDMLSFMNILFPILVTLSLLPLNASISLISVTSDISSQFPISHDIPFVSPPIIDDYDFLSEPVNNDSPPSLPITTRHSIRNINAPSYLQDYVCNNIHASTYPISNYISHNNLSNLHSHFIMSIHSNHEHKTYIEASKFDC